MEHDKSIVNIGWHLLSKRLSYWLIDWLIHHHKPVNQSIDRSVNHLNQQAKLDPYFQRVRKTKAFINFLHRFRSLCRVKCSNNNLLSGSTYRDITIETNAFCQRYKLRSFS